MSWQMKKEIVIVTVQRGNSQALLPAGKRESVRKGVYVRQGASTVPATEAAILNMIKKPAVTVMKLPGL